MCHCSGDATTTTRVEYVDDLSPDDTQQECDDDVTYIRQKPDEGGGAKLATEGGGTLGHTITERIRAAWKLKPSGTHLD